MAQRSRAALTAICLLLVLGGASAFSFPFFGKKKTEDNKKDNVVESDGAGTSTETAPASASADAKDSKSAVFWLNDVTGETQWEVPSYERVNGESAQLSPLFRSVGCCLGSRRNFIVLSAWMISVLFCFTSIIHMMYL